jgi:hypothetical protein
MSKSSFNQDDALMTLEALGGNATTKEVELEAIKKGWLEKETLHSYSNVNKKLCPLTRWDSVIRDDKGNYRIV